MTEVALVGEIQFTTGVVLRLLGGVFLLLGSVYGFVRYEENPIVTEYGSGAYVLLGEVAVWAVGLLGSLVAS